MRLFIFLLLLFMSANPLTLYDFSTDSSLSNWRIVNDGVMGGLSEGTLYVNDDGHGVFEGDISLQNNGGFSSVRYFFPYVDVNNDSRLSIRLKGDNKPYQIRVKHNRRASYSYVYTIQTSGKWQKVTIPIREMRPEFRGRKLDMPDFDHDQIGEFTILFGNKKRESFKLMIDSITLE